MTNELFLEQMKKLYDSLTHFHIQDYYLILNAEKEFKIPLIHTNLANLNPSLFLLHPKEIFQIIYMLELLYKKELTESEIEFITKYTEKYLELDQQAKNGDQVDTNRLWNLGIAINLAYDNEFANTSCSNIIISLVDKQITEINSAHNKNPKLVLIKGDNINFETEEEENTFQYFKEAGFTTLFLILLSIVGTCLFIAYYIVGH